MKHVISHVIKNGDGFITKDELRTVMNSMGQRLTEEELNEMMEAADSDKDGRIDYAEFVKMMTQQ